jgi:hypothetical protein
MLNLYRLLEFWVEGEVRKVSVLRVRVDDGNPQFLP